MSRCFPFPSPGYENEKKLSNGELGHVHKKSKHKHKHKHGKEKKQKKREREDEVQVDLLIEKKDKKHKHHKYEKDKGKDRYGEHEFEDSKDTGVTHDSPTREETSFKFVERERPGTLSCNKGDISQSERSRQSKDEVRDNEMRGNQKMDEDRAGSDYNVRKRKDMDTIFFDGHGDAEENFNKRETIGVKFVERESLRNGKHVTIDLPEREESRQNCPQTTDNGMKKGQKIGNTGDKSYGEVMKGKEVNTRSHLHGGNTREIAKKRGALSIKFVDKEQPCNVKRDKMNPLDNEKFLTDGDDDNGIVMKRNKISTNSYPHGNRPWQNLPVLMDKWSHTQIQTTFAKEVYSDIGRAAQDAKKLLVECISTSHVQNARNHVLGKNVDSTSFHPSFSGRENCCPKSFQSKFTKEARFSTGKVAKEVKYHPIECMRKARLEEATNASFEHCFATASPHPLFSVKDKDFNKCHEAVSPKEVHSDSENKMQDAHCCAVGRIPGSKVQEVSTDHQFSKCHQATSAKEIHSDGQNKVQDAQCCAVGCIAESKVQEVSIDHHKKRAASASHRSSTVVKKKPCNTVSQTTSFEDFQSDGWRKVQDSKECAVECIPQIRIQLDSNAGFEKCVARTSCNLSFSSEDKLSIKQPQTALTEKAQFNSERRGQEANRVAVECKSGSRAQEASTAILQTCVTSASCTSFQGNDCERNGMGMSDCMTVSHIIGHSHGAIEAINVSSESRADCSTASHFTGHSHGTTEAVDAVPSRIRANCKTTAHLIGPSNVPTEAVDVSSSGSKGNFKATLHFIRPSHSTTKTVDTIHSGSRPDGQSLELKHFSSLPIKQLCSDLDDQSWLFLSNSKNMKATEKFGHASIVWDQLLVLQTTNAYALPYVSPF